MAALDGSGGAGRNQGSSPERERGRRRKVSCGSETDRAGDGADADGGENPQNLQV